MVSVCWPLYTVRLDDGSQVTTHHANLVRDLPGAARKRRPEPRPAADGVDNTPLWT